MVHITGNTECFTVLGKLNLPMDDGLILCSSQFMLLPQLSRKTKLYIKMVKLDLKIIATIPKILIRETHCRLGNDDLKFKRFYELDVSLNVCV